MDRRVGRFWLGLSGQDLDEHLLRYGAMVARLYGDAGFRFDAASRAPAPQLLLASSLPSRTNGQGRPVHPSVASAPKICPPPEGDEFCQRLTFKSLPPLAGAMARDVLLVSLGVYKRGMAERLGMRVACSLWLATPDGAPVIRRILVPV